MINRRHIRIKVMQSVYAVRNTENYNLDQEEKFIQSSLNKVYDLYVLQIDLLMRIHALSKSIYEIALDRNLSGDFKGVPSKKFAENKFFNHLAASKSLSNYVEENLSDFWPQYEELIRRLYDKILDSDLYAKYKSIDQQKFSSDKKFVLQIFKEIVAPDDGLFELYEDAQISWIDDLPFVNTWVLKSLKDVGSSDTLILPALFKNSVDEKFGVELFRKVVLNQNQYDEDIKKNTPNWDFDRIAEIDLILIEMGIAEFLEFPSIPVKVSMNEYIEIAKDYSTEKSGVFINGVLDKVQKDFDKNNRLNKFGRGLL